MSGAPGTSPQVSAGQFQVSFVGKTFLEREEPELPRAKPASSSTTNFGPTDAAAGWGVLSLTATSPIGCRATRWHWHELTIDARVPFKVNLQWKVYYIARFKNANFEADRNR
jgi:hypothetical protein